MRKGWEDKKPIEWKSMIRKKKNGWTRRETKSEIKKKKKVEKKIKMGMR